LQSLSLSLSLSLTTKDEASSLER